MKLSSRDSFVLYNAPFSTKTWLIQGVWEPLLDSGKGFVVQTFDGEDAFILKGEKRNLSKSDKFVITVEEELKTEEEQTRLEYEEQLNKFIKACNVELEKVISSRVVLFRATKTIDVYALFLELKKKYPSAFVYVFNIPNRGMWVGATPEILVKEKNGIVETMALAGTKPNKNIAWTSKELEEHAFVVEDIKEKLRKNKQGFSIGEVETVQAGEVYHLKTKIEINKGKSSSLQIAQILHPTSAVCGMPQDKAKEFIFKNENYNRTFYTGFLGWVGEKETDLYVNLRCMRVYKNGGEIFVGGGITRGSIAKKEWKETELKSRTLLSILEKM